MSPAPAEDLGLIQNLGYSTVRPRICTIMPALSTQRDRALKLLNTRGMVRLSEFRSAGITATTISRPDQAGEITRLARGLYQLPNAELDANHTLAETAKLVPKGVICLISALAFHDLIDKIPSKVWMAIESKDWRPTITHPPLRFARFPPSLLRKGIEIHEIEGTPVRIFGVAKTLADVFRYRNTVGVSIAIEGLRSALRARKTTAAEIARHAADGAVWKVMEPYVTTLTHG